MRHSIARRRLPRRSCSSRPGGAGRQPVRQVDDDRGRLPHLGQRPDRRRERQPDRRRRVRRRARHRPGAELDRLLPERPRRPGPGRRVRPARSASRPRGRRRTRASLDIENGPLRRVDLHRVARLLARDACREHDHRLQLLRATRTLRRASRCRRSRSAASPRTPPSSPSRVLADYQVPALPQCPEAAASASQSVVFGTSEMVAAGIDYVTSLKKGVLAGKPVVINMSLGGAADDEISAVERAAIDRAIAAGVIVVAAASNDGELGHERPRLVPRRSSPPARSAGPASGWTTGRPAPAPANRLALPHVVAQERARAPEPGPPAPPTAAVCRAPATSPRTRPSSTTPTSATSRAAPRTPRAGRPRRPRPRLLGPRARRRRPWLQPPAVVRSRHRRPRRPEPRQLLLRRRHLDGHPARRERRRARPAEEPGLPQGQVESILRGSALPLAPTASTHVWDPFNAGGPGFYPIPWDTDCDGVACDAVGAGLLQADGAIAATP